MNHLIKSLQIVSALVAGTIFFSCSKEEPFIEPIIEEGNLNFGELAVGQRSLYLRYSSSCGSGGFEFTGDTLIVETVSLSNKIFFKESLTFGSPMNVGGYKLFEVKKEEDEILIPERDGSYLFFFYDNDTIHLRPAARVDLFQQDCRMILGNENFSGNEIGLINDFRIGPIRQVDKTVVTCVPPMLNLDAYLIYDENYLFMSHTVSSGNVQSNAVGWKLMY
jgi:hypothetical protein